MRNNIPYLVFTCAGFLTENQLRTMHRNLGYPTLEKQMRAIENANAGHLNEKTRKILKEIVEQCKPCQISRVKPRRFLFFMKDDTTGEFNHCLEVDVVSIDVNNVLHVICTGPAFSKECLSRACLRGQHGERSNNAGLMCLQEHLATSTPTPVRISLQRN